MDFCFLFRLNKWGLLSVSTCSSCQPICVCVCVFMTTTHSCSCCWQCLLFHVPPCFSTHRCLRTRTGVEFFLFLFMLLFCMCANTVCVPWAVLFFCLFSVSEMLDFFFSKESRVEVCVCYLFNGSQPSMCNDSLLLFFTPSPYSFIFIGCFSL